jgi:type I restriction enzyme S subunit
MNKTPAVRFIGFAEDWEQRKLGDLLQTLPFKQFLKEPEPDGKYEIIQQGNEPVIGFANGTPCGDYKDVVIFGDHTLSLYKPQHPFFVATDGVRIVKGQQDTDGYYLLSLLERYKPQSEGYKRYYSILADTNCITTYNTSEQEKIGVFFKLLDNLITLHQRKYDKLTNVKKSMLEKMFPKNGSNVPEIRFKGFTDAWEQRKLGDIADIVGGGTPSTGNQSYWNGDIDWYAPAEIADQIYANSSQKKITGLGYENSSAKMLPPGTVLFTSRAGIGKTAILTRKGCTNQGFQSIVPHRGELDSYFIFSRTEELKRYGELVGTGSTFVEVSGKQMAVMELMMPPTMREQQTIGGFFQQLDSLIALHHRKLEKLEQIKQAMLHKMFV